MIRLLIVDDNQLWRKGVRLLLDDSDEFEVVGQARNGKEAIELAVKLMPNVVLMDIKMPVMDGLSATKKIMSRDRHPEIVILAMAYDAVHVRQALRSGAKGYVAKHEFMTELIPAIKAVYEGKTYLSPSVANESGGIKAG